MDRSTRIEDLGLTTRTVSALRSIGVATVAGIVRLGADGLRRAGAGSRTIAAVREAVHPIDLGGADEPDRVRVCCTRCPWKGNRVREIDAECPDCSGPVERSTRGVGRPPSEVETVRVSFRLDVAVAEKLRARGELAAVCRAAAVALVGKAAQ
jgi:hypothetical protein